MRTNHLCGDSIRRRPMDIVGRARRRRGRAPLRVEAEGETVTVIAKHVPLRDVLDQLQAQAGFALIESSDRCSAP